MLVTYRKLVVNADPALAKRIASVAPLIVEKQAGA